MGDLADQLNNGQPIVRQIQSVLRDKIRDGELQPGQKLPSMRRLSVEFRCSLGIVKQAVNTLSAQGFLRSSPRRGVYVADQAPVGREIAVVLPHLELERLHVAMRGIRRGIAGTTHRITIHAGERSADRPGPIPDYLTSPNVAGAMLLLPSAGEHDELRAVLRRHGVPTVVVDVTPRTAGADVVAIDTVETGRLGAQLLLDHGHRKIALVEPRRDVKAPPEVLTGIEKALKDGGIAPEDLVRIGIDRVRDPAAPLPSPAWQITREVVSKAFADGLDVSAIIGIGPSLTIGAHLGAKDAGKRVPDDLSVIGLLGDSSALQTTEPPVTIVDNPLLAICETAARRLVERIDGYSAAPETIRVSPQLIERQSVARA